MTALVEIVDPEELRSKRRLGVQVALWLATLTLVEYFIAVGISRPLIPLIPFAAAKGWLILKYFMHMHDVTDEVY